MIRNIFWNSPKKSQLTFSVLYLMKFKNCTDLDAKLHIDLDCCKNQGVNREPKHSLDQSTGFYFYVNLTLKGVCHEIFNFHFSWFEPIWAPDQQAKVFMNSVLISPRYSITKFEKFDSVVCMLPQSQNFRLSKSNFFSSILFFNDRCVHP